MIELLRGAVLAAVAVGAAAAAPAQARELTLRSCARIEDAMVRLACYDALARQREEAAGDADHDDSDASGTPPRDSG